MKRILAWVVITILFSLGAILVANAEKQPPDVGIITKITTKRG